MFMVIPTENGFVLNISSKEDRKLFQELVQRATNLWPDAPPSVKEFADIITNDWAGNKPLQDYKQQDTSGRTSAKSRRRGITCAHCDHINLVDVLEATTLVAYSCTQCGKINEAYPVTEN